MCLALQFRSPGARAFSFTEADSLNSAQLSERVCQCALRIRESGVAALSGLFDLTSARLVRLAVTITRNQHDAEDAVQAALLRVTANPTLLCRANQPWPYLLRMVRNEALVILRKRGRASVLDDLSDLHVQSFVDEAEQRESKAAIWQALRKLPTQQSEIVVLKIWEELTFAEISEILNINASTAASRYRYALEKLERLLRTAKLGANA